MVLFLIWQWGLVLLLHILQHLDENIDIGLDGSRNDGAVLGLEGILLRLCLGTELEGKRGGGRGPGANFLGLGG